MKTLSQEKYNHSESSITVEVSRRTQKVEVYLANERFGLANFSTDLGHIFGSNVVNEFRVMLRRKRPHKTEFAYNLVRMHSTMIWRDAIEYIFVGDTKTAILCCFLFSSEVKVGDIRTTGQYMKF